MIELAQLLVVIGIGLGIAFAAYLLLTIYRELRKGRK